MEIANFFLKYKPTKPEVMTHIFNHCTSEIEAGISEFKVSLVCRPNSMTAGD